MFPGVRGKAYCPGRHCSKVTRFPSWRHKPVACWSCSPTNMPMPRPRPGSGANFFSRFEGKQPAPAKTMFAVKTAMLILYVRLFILKDLRALAKENPSPRRASSTFGVLQNFHSMENDITSLPAETLKSGLTLGSSSGAWESPRMLAPRRSNHQISKRFQA